MVGRLAIDQSGGMMEGIDGIGEDKKLWQTYVYWARRDIKDGLDVEPAGEEAIADKPSQRIEDRLAKAIQSLLFSALMLEYRLKRVLAYVGLPVNRRDGLEKRLELIRKELPKLDRKDGKGKSALPAEWQDCESKFEFLRKFRNRVAHANYDELLELFQGTDPIEVARLYYNRVVDFMIALNICTGNETRSWDEVEKYFRPLRIITKPK
jgi:hypothetical protein